MMLAFANVASGRALLGWRKHLFFLLLVAGLATILTGCENTDMQLATEAGVDAFKAVTLSDQDVMELAGKSSALMDKQHSVAPPENQYTKRLRSLVGDLYEQDGYTFNYRVYLRDEVNAFAMADGSIRIFSGLMDMLNDGELRFVIGHEMGHIVKQHTAKQLRLAYAASAVRKGLAAQEGVVADIARSQLGGLVQRLTAAQFSQLEEKVADDYGLSFLKAQGYAPEDAVSALNKLAALGSGHSFLSSHPDPALRAERISLQIQGKALSIEETQENILTTMKQKMIEWYNHLRDMVMGLIKSLAGLSDIKRGVA
ncbi:Peptidase M48 Ste24p [Pseudodesulfovibrio profundus]|jgi:putative metalloprotease|uniref:Peptidase M48 Ste24p n=1 Tax=Pseudodesulfovibrio profundus TaxID=57320 RepID=A0A2C8F459_9BACT|nr:M48 family metallopeptidase [Pseudodesulfovibrio profundus]SOB57510.1 Peptidase M48 Ste24p [Pseudodesulfovibrio profundus]